MEQEIKGLLPPNQLTSRGSNEKTAGILVSLALVLFSGICSVSVKPRIAKIELIYE